MIRPVTQRAGSTSLGYRPGHAAALLWPAYEKPLVTPTGVLRWRSRQTGFWC